MTGFISGVFDCLHKGHTFLLSEAKKQCNQLIVSINSDGYIRRVKKREPIDRQDVRARKLLATGLVDSVIVRDEDSPLTDILVFKPARIFVGDDYTFDRVVGYEEIKAWGGEVVIIKRIPGISTTEILKQSNGT